jgi:DNA-binding NtrC family response regulator/ligand-binding sensor domain-containing protein
MGCLNTQTADAKRLYEQAFWPLLKSQGLKAGIGEAPSMPTGVFSQLFEVESPQQVSTINKVLSQHPQWHQAQRSMTLGRSSSTANPAVQSRFELYEMAAAEGKPVELSPIYPQAGTGTTQRAGPGTTVRSGQGIQRGLWHNLRVEDGLSSSSVISICSDAAGALWFGTMAGGACRFDGDQLTVFTIADGLAHNTIAVMYRDQADHLWFGTEGGGGREGGGITRYDGTSFTTFTTTDGLPHNSVYALCQDRRGHLWLGTGKGCICRYDGSAFETYTIDRQLGSIRAIFEDSTGHMWFGTDRDGLVGYDGRVFTRFSADLGLADQGVLAIGQDRQGDLWCGTVAGGVSRYNGAFFRTYSIADGLADNGVRTICRDDQDHLWFGTHGDRVSGGGVTRYDGNCFKTYTTAAGLADDTVADIAQDIYGHMWFGTGTLSRSGHGVCRYDGAHFDHFTTADGLPHDQVSSVLEDRQGRLWFSTFEGVCHYDGEKFISLKGLKGYVRNIFEDRRGILWFGTAHDGVYRYDGSHFTQLNKSDGLLTDEFIRDIVEDQEGQIWLATSAGISVFDGTRFSNYSEEEGLVRGAVNRLVVDKKGQIWVATDGGVSCWNGRCFTRLISADGLANDCTPILFEDRSGALWFGTANRGVFCYDGQDWTHFTTADGLACNLLLGIYQDREGIMWFSCYGGGLTCFDGHIFQTLNTDSGLLDNGVHKVIQDRRDDFWIITERGLSRYRPHTVAPQVYLDPVAMDHEFVPNSTLELTGPTEMSFAFGGKSFLTHWTKLAYSFRLEGHDTTWRTTREQRVKYPKLNLGKYTFQVRAVDQNLNYSEPASAVFELIPDPQLLALTKVLNQPSGASNQFVGTSLALRQVQAQLQQVAATDLTVLIEGETGTGKGLAARTLHDLSPRREGPLIQVNCGALPETLVESELFGHEKGAFTGAVARKLGKVDLAAGGTLFLDEIGDLALEAQVKLLRLLEEGIFERVGGTQTLRAKVRVVAATNRDLTKMVAAGTFREDLYFRLQVFPVHLPPLRQRREDIPLLAVYFLEPKAKHLNKPIAGLTPEAQIALQTYEWPGNVRELQHAVERAAVVCNAAEIGIEDLSMVGKTHGKEQGEEQRGKQGGKSDAPLLTLSEVERQYIRSVLERVGWVIRGPQGAAAILGLPASTLRDRIKKLGIKRV